MKKYIIIVFIAVISVVSANAQTYKVIVNATNGTTSLSKKEVTNYLLKKRNKWADAVRVVPVDLSSKSEVRKVFAKEVQGKSVSQIRAFWQQSVFSGKATPPQEMQSDEEVIAFVKQNKGAIGYVSGSANVSGVKVITVN